MEWTKLHGPILGQAFSKVLGRAESGAMAFVRCLPSDVVKKLAEDDAFGVRPWKVLRVADADVPKARTITADTAVEQREDKGDATLLLVDTDLAGAGMDGIYSASREVDETSLFREARRLAAAEVTRQLSRTHRQYAERAIKKAEGYGGQYSVSPWAAFDFLCRVAARKQHPGAYLYLLGMWPVSKSEALDSEEALNLSHRFADHLLGTAAIGQTIPARIESLRLAKPTDDQRRDLETFLHTAETQPRLSALEKLADGKHLWVGALKMENAQAIESIELNSWRNRNGTIAKWSGLVEQAEDAPPALILKPDAETAADYSTLEIKWKARPGNLEKNAAEYRVAVLTDTGELAERNVVHSAKREEKCRFNNDDFSMLNEDSLVSAKVAVSVVGAGDDKVESQESEEFFIRFGEPPEKTAGGAGKMVRAFSEGVVELGDRENVSTIADNPTGFSVDEKKNEVLLRTPAGANRLSLRVPCPPLIREVEQQWMGRAGRAVLGRWRVKVRESGVRAGEVAFIRHEGAGQLWDRATAANRKLADYFNKVRSGVGCVYDDKAKAFDLVKEYINAWTALLENGDPSLALCNTVEVQSLSGRLIGLIVLPMHPLRVAWHAAYDNLVLHAAFEQHQKAKDIWKELQCLDGAMFPAFLPNPSGGSFVFADTLDFHAVGMVQDTDKEPKAAMAILARAMGAGEAIDAASTVGEQSAKVVGNEIVNYLDYHNTGRLLHIHALRAGDGLTIAKSLGHVHARLSKADEEANSEDENEVPVFSLEMYPSKEQRGIAGRFIVEARERRRSGAGGVSPGDQWMLESLSLPGGVNMPRLRWARKERPNPETAAHLAVAFDTFESQVVLDEQKVSGDEPLQAFGLLSFYDRHFTTKPTPMWRSAISLAKDGEKHPSERVHTDRLVRLQRAIQHTVARHVGAANGQVPVLQTAVSSAKAKSLENLHRLCDWVITLDRNAGIEYFDSPRDNRAIYDAYVIDCVPEREDLGCLQLITSTSNTEEVHRLLVDTLDQMGLSHRRRNAEFLLEHLKALSGRLAIRLTGDKPLTSELIALAVSQANCQRAREADPCWVSLDRGFIVPIDDVRDLLPPLTDEEKSPKLIYVTKAPRKGLNLRFVEVEYRRDLRTARSPAILHRIREQTAEMCKRWNDWYSHDECSAFRAVRRAKLARILRFYADKARRHHLPAARYAELVAEIDRMIEKGGAYELEMDERESLGWVFCPEYAGANPLKISADNWSTQVFMFGPSLLPDSAQNAEGFTGHRETSQDRAEDAASQVEQIEAPQPLSDVAVATFRMRESQVEQIDAPQPPIDAVPAICFGTDSFTNAKVRWPLTVKGNPHLLIAGLPGMGKTTCLLNICKQMMAARIRPIIFSYHQDIDEQLEHLVNSVRFVDFDGLGFNPLEVSQRESRQAHLDVAGALRDIFAAIYPELGDIQAERIRGAIKDSFVELGWGNADAAIPDLQEPAFSRFVEILRAKPKPDRGLLSLLARLEELEDYGFFTLRESHSNLWESEHPTVIRIHTTQNDNLQRAFASLVFYSLYKDMFRRGIQARITHALIFDEAHRAAGLKLIPTMAKECRKYGISLVLASQEARDFDVSVFSAIANYLVLRLTEVDAKSLVRNVANSQRERGLIDKIKQMERFKAMYFCEERKTAAQIALSPSL